MERRDFLKIMGAGAASLAATRQSPRAAGRSERPNVVFVFADQWRLRATGYSGNQDVRTPHLDRVAERSVNMSHAVSTCSVCCPYRASLLTGQFPLTHGVFLNDVRLGNEAVSVAEAYARAGYDTAYIGKWHLDGHARDAIIPENRRQGFRYWKAMGCTHDYNNSFYYTADNRRKKWKGYDAIAQTRDAQRYIREHSTGRPFCLFISWGPPHAPYHTAPSKYRRMFDPGRITLPPNVPEDAEKRARGHLAGYYAHIAALDECLGALVQTLRDRGLAERTILVLTSDHGDMLHSHGMMKKQRPHDESIRVPFLVHYPAALGRQGREIDMPFGTPDIMPTLLGLSDVPLPETVEGTDYSEVITGRTRPEKEAALITCPAPFGQWRRESGGREYRGLRTRRYTYVRDLKGPWLLFDNEKDPYQLHNLVESSEHAALRERLDGMLKRRLRERGDEFDNGWEYITRWGHRVNDTGTAPYFH